MPDPAIQKLRADFLKPKKPDGWQSYNLLPVYTGITDSLDAQMTSGGVTIVYKASRGDYHVQTEIARDITQLDPTVLQELLDEERPHAKKQLPVLARQRNAKGEFVPADLEE